MICLECAACHPGFKQPPHSVPLRETRCPICRKERLCVENSVVGVPNTFMKIEEAFQFIAGEVVKGKLR